MNKSANNESSIPQDVNNSKKTWVIVGLGTLAIVIFWIILTVVAPLLKGDGVSKYSGVQKELAQNIVDVTHDVNGPDNLLYPDFMFKVHVDDIHPVNKDEIATYCKGVNPAYITDDANDYHHYTVTVSEQYLFSPSVKTTTYVGCNHTDYIYTSVFGYPEGLDPRTKIDTQ